MFEDLQIVRRTMVVRCGSVKAVEIVVVAIVGNKFATRGEHRRDAQETPGVL